MDYQNIDMNYLTLSSIKDGLKEHYHNGYELIFITEGSSKFIINNSNYDFPKNHLLFINNVEKHKMFPKSIPYSRYMVIIDSDYLDDIIKENELLSIFKIRPSNFKHGFRIIDEDVPFVKSILNNLNNIYSKKESLWYIEFTSTLASFLVYIYRNYNNQFPIMNIKKSEQKVFEIQQYIDKNFKKNITLNFLSSKFFISKYYLSHTFKHVTGFTIKQYILLKRIAHAKDRLYHTDDDITTIALSSGFNSQSNFIRLFKKKESITPLKFRKYHKENTV